MDSMNGSINKPPLKPPGTGGTRPKPTAEDLIEQYGGTSSTSANENGLKLKRYTPFQPAVVEGMGGGSSKTFGGPLISSSLKHTPRTNSAATTQVNQ